jgi:hypothetical protein
MTELHEINYRVLIDRLMQDFPPIKRLWPVSTRLLLLILLEAAILAFGVLRSGSLDLPAVVHFHNHGLGAAGFVLVSIAAAWIALRSSMPGRETSAVLMIVLAFAVIAAALMVQLEPSTRNLTSLADFFSTLRRLLTFAALPWLALFWAARRAMPLQPRLTGGLIGIAASCFAIVAELFNGAFHAIAWELVAGAILTLLSVIAGAAWLDSERLWRIDRDSSVGRPVDLAWLDARVIFPVAGALAMGLLLVALKTGPGADGRVPDFDLAIENYQQSLTDFRPNVPSTSLETVLTAYIEHGMPSYMWDFGPQGFKLQGGRFERLADGSPVTYTWFRGPKAGVMCMFRQVSGFEAPNANHSELHHLLFYRYRGYSVCLINVGGYGNFVSVIVCPIPMKLFMPMVLDALSIQQR